MRLAGVRARSCKQLQGQSRWSIAARKRLRDLDSVCVLPEPFFSFGPFSQLFLHHVRSDCTRLVWPRAAPHLASRVAPEACCRWPLSCSHSCPLPRVCFVCLLFLPLGFSRSSSSHLNSRLSIPDSTSKHPSHMQSSMHCPARPGTTRARRNACISLVLAWEIHSRHATTHKHSPLSAPPHPTLHWHTPHPCRAPAELIS